MARCITYNCIHCRPCGAAARTASRRMLDAVDWAKGTPALAAARASIASPPGRTKPLGRARRARRRYSSVFRNMATLRCRAPLSILVRRIGAIEQPTQCVPISAFDVAVVACELAARALEDGCGRMDHGTATRQRGNLNLARAYQEAHQFERLAHTASHRQKPMVARNQHVLVADVRNQAHLLVLSKLDGGIDLRRRAASEAGRRSGHTRCDGRAHAGFIQAAPGTPAISRRKASRRVAIAHHLVVFCRRMSAAGNEIERSELPESVNSGRLRDAALRASALLQWRPETG